MKYVGAFILFTLLTQGIAQETYTIPFQDLLAADTAISMNAAAELLQTVQYHNADCIIVEPPEGEQASIYMFGWQAGQWVGYGLPLYSDRVSEYALLGFSEDGNYFLATFSQNNFTRGHETSSTELIIIDVRAPSFAAVSVAGKDFQWHFDDSDNQVDSTFSFSSEYFLDGNAITILSPCNKEPCDDYGGEYEIHKEHLIKTKRYDPHTHHMYPVRYAGPIATGMSRQDLDILFSSLQLKQVPRNMYGDDTDDEQTGYELYQDGELLAFVVLVDNRISQISAVSSTINFGAVSTACNIEEVVRLYPGASLHVDLINDWEYIYIDQLDITLYFRTDNDNRVGDYRFDEKERDDVMTGLKRHDARPDFITVGS